MNIWLWSFKEPMVVRFWGGFDYVFKLQKYYLDNGLSKNGLFSFEPSFDLSLIIGTLFQLSFSAEYPA